MPDDDTGKKLREEPLADYSGVRADALHNAQLAYQRLEAWCATDEPNKVLDKAYPLADLKYAASLVQVDEDGSVEHNARVRSLLADTKLHTHLCARRQLITTD